MADAQDLLRLADEVAAATGPDRELDRQIHEHVRGKQYRWAEFGGATAFADQKRIGVEVEPSWLTDEMYQWWMDRSDVGVIPAYTASLDAAMTLVPEGWGWMVSQPNEKAIASGLLKERTPVHGEVQYGCDHRYAVAAATPSLALCAAALKARAHSTKESDNG